MTTVLVLSGSGQQRPDVLDVIVSVRPVSDRQLGDDVEAMAAVTGGAVGGRDGEVVDAGIADDHEPSVGMVAEGDTDRRAAVPQGVGGEFVQDQDDALGQLPRPLR